MAENRKCLNCGQLLSEEDWDACCFLGRTASADLPPLTLCNDSKTPAASDSNSNKNELFLSGKTVGLGILAWARLQNTPTFRPSF